MTRELVADQSLPYTWTGTDASLGLVVLMTHPDVVPVDEGTEKDWKAYARTERPAGEVPAGRNGNLSQVRGFKDERP